MQKGICLSVVGLFMFCSMAMADFVDNGDDTVTDTATGLMWQKFEVMTEDGAEDSRMTWQEALAYCEKLELAGYDDWRLPNAKELQSIVDYETDVGPTIDEIFENAMSSIYWSSTTYAGNTDEAWNVIFSNGYVGHYYKSRTYRVRAVRGGQ